MAEPPLFAALQEEELLGGGVPEDWIETVRAATETRFFDLAAHLPAEAAEALLDYAATGRLQQPAPADSSDPFAHPDARRRFRTIENVEALQVALDAPWERWAVFLHPSQAGVVERDYGGPARVAGSAGTGKSVVAVHRAVRLARSSPDARVLLTTFSKPLADALQRKVNLLLAAEPGLAGRITVAPWEGLADELHNWSMHGGPVSRPTPRSAQPSLLPRPRTRPGPNASSSPSSIRSSMPGRCRTKGPTA